MLTWGEPVMPLHCAPSGQGASPGAPPPSAGFFESALLGRRLRLNRGHRQRTLHIIEGNEREIGGVCAAWRFATALLRRRDNNSSRGSKHIITEACRVTVSPRLIDWWKESSSTEAVTHTLPECRCAQMAATMSIQCIRVPSKQVPELVGVVGENRAAWSPPGSHAQFCVSPSTSRRRAPRRGTYIGRTLVVSISGCGFSAELLFDLLQQAQSRILVFARGILRGMPVWSRGPPPNAPAV